MVSEVNKSRPDAYVKDTEREAETKCVGRGKPSGPSHSDSQAEQCAGSSKLIFRSQGGSSSLKAAPEC